MRLLLLPLIGTLTLAAPAAEGPTLAQVAQAHAVQVHDSYAAALLGAESLQAALDALAAAPTVESLQAARAAWLAAREPYGLTEAFRFAGGPIDDEDGPEALLNGWPLDEQYIDATTDAPQEGIVNAVQKYPEITAELLISLNEKDGDANIATGYHAIEFLLWGQDLNAEPRSAGQRPLSDFTTAPNAARRLRYLTVCAGLIVQQLRGLVDAWAPDQAGNHRARWLGDPQAAVAGMIVSIGSLAGGELAGERMAVALQNRDQEDEHSCFSDNTHRDIVRNAEGIAQVWQGGSQWMKPGADAVTASLRGLVATADAALVTEIDAALQAAVERCAAIQAPFDQEILGGDDAPGRRRVQAAIDALWAFTRLLPKAADALQLKAEIIGL